MNDEQLNEIEARANAATEGPWGPYASEPEHVIIAGGGAITVAGNYDYEDGGVIYPDDLTFIVHAREDVPALLAEVRRLTERCEHLRQTLATTASERGGFRTDRERARDAAVFLEQENARLAARVAELEATPADWDAQRRSADVADARLEQLRAYAHWCKDRSVEPEERDILALANGEECHDYVALLKRQGGEATC